MEAENEGKQIRITRMSRSSWFKLEIGGRVIHLDPGFSGLYDNQGIPELEFGKKADLVLISHSHKDHIQPEAMQKILKPETAIFAPNACRELIERPFSEVKPGDKVDLGWVSFTAVHAYNTPEGRSTQKFHQKGDFVGYLIDLGSKRLYFAGDSDLIPEMKSLGKVDIAFLPIGGTYVMDLDEAVESVKVIQPGLVVPMHHAQTDMALFGQKVRQQSGGAVQILGVGESFMFDRI